jgi:hypothetical protein
MYTQLGDFGVAVARDILQLATIPANLKSQYETLKKAIQATNNLYARKPLDSESELAINQSPRNRKASSRYGSALRYGAL